MHIKPLVQILRCSHVAFRSTSHPTEGHSVCRDLCFGSLVDALQTKILKFGVLIDRLIILCCYFFQEERFQMVFDLAQELIDEDYHRADVISSR